MKRVAHSLVGAVLALLVLGPALALAQFGGNGGLNTGAGGRGANNCNSSSALACLDVAVEATGVDVDTGTFACMECSINSATGDDSTAAGIHIVEPTNGWPNAWLQTPPLPPFAMLIDNNGVVSGSAGTRWLTAADGPGIGMSTYAGGATIAGPINFVWGESGYMLGNSDPGIHFTGASYESGGNTLQGGVTFDFAAVTDADADAYGGNVAYNLANATGNTLAYGGAYGVTCGDATGPGAVGGSVSYVLGDGTGTGGVAGGYTVTSGVGTDDDSTASFVINAKGMFEIYSNSAWTGGASNVYAPFYVTSQIGADNKPLALFNSTPGSGITAAPAVDATVTPTNALASGETRIAVRATFSAHASDNSNSDTVGVECAFSGGGPGRESCLHNDVATLPYIIDSDGGHAKLSGFAPTISSCGNTPAAGTSSDTRGRVTTGSGTVNSCTITFATAFVAAPVCVVGVDDSTTALPTWTTSTSALTVTFAVSSPSKHVSYHCFE